jgi:hypothetical protein
MFVLEWLYTGSMGQVRKYQTASVLKNGQVLVAGGGYWNDFMYRDYYLHSAEVYDPSTGRWTGTGNLQNARGLHTVSILIDGKVLVSGGAVRVVV